MSESVDFGNTPVCCAVGERWGGIGGNVIEFNLEKARENETLTQRAAEFEASWGAVRRVSDMQSGGPNDDSVSHSHDEFEVDVTNVTVTQKVFQTRSNGVVNEVCCAWNVKEALQLNDRDVSHNFFLDFHGKVLPPFPCARLVR